MHGVEVVAKVLNPFVETSAGGWNPLAVIVWFTVLVCTLGVYIADKK